MYMQTSVLWFITDIYVEASKGPRGGLDLGQKAKVSFADREGRIECWVWAWQTRGEWHSGDSTESSERCFLGTSVNRVWLDEARGRGRIQTYNVAWMLSQVLRQGWLGKPNEGSQGVNIRRTTSQNQSLGRASNGGLGLDWSPHARGKRTIVPCLI